MSQVVPRRGLEVLQPLLSLSTMSPRSAANTGIGTGASPALPTGGEGLPQTAAEQLAMLGPQRVRALGRAARSANGSGCRQSDAAVESSARRSPHARRRPSESRLQFIAGGQRLLTVDRQKTEQGPGMLRYGSGRGHRLTLCERVARNA